MKNAFQVAFLLLGINTSNGQNVGIGTTTPSEKLEIKNASRSTVKISSANYTDTSTLEFANRDGLNQGTSFHLSARREEGLVVTTTSDLPFQVKDSLFSIMLGGNVGIGKKNPRYRLDVHDPSQNTAYINVTNSTTGSTANDGLVMGMVGTTAGILNLENGPLHLATNGTSRLSISESGNVGIGNLSPAYKLDVNGNMNLTGTLRINGNAGTAGQVLTSNGGSDPTWANGAYSNNTRFAVLIEENATSKDGDARIFNTLYNQNSGNVSIGASSITINKSGLYHFDMSLISSITYTTAATVYPDHELWFYFGLPNSLKLIDKKMDPFSNTNTSWVGQEKVSVEVYITAPATLRFYHSLGELGGGTVSSYNVEGFVTGHLISD